MGHERAGFVEHGSLRCRLRAESIHGLPCHVSGTGKAREGGLPNGSIERWLTGVVDGLHDHSQPEPLKFDFDALRRGTEKADQVAELLFDPARNDGEALLQLKDLFDALQGCIGDKGKRGLLQKIIPSDSQIYRVVAEKRLAPKANRNAASVIVISRYDQHGSTARSARDARKHQPPKGGLVGHTARPQQVSVKTGR